MRLIDSLFAGCSEEQKAKLLSLYRTAFSGSEDYKKICYILESCEFYGSLGEELRRRIKSVIGESFNDAESFSSMLTVLEHIINRAEDELSLTEAYVNSARLDAQKLSVVEKSFAKQSVDFYSALANYLCCRYAILYGKDIIREISIDLHTGTLDVVRLVTETMCTVNNEVMHRRKPFVWKITRQSFGGINPVKYDGLVLSAVSGDAGGVLASCKKIAPNIYVDGSDRRVLCYGVGNITNLDYRNGTSVLGAEIIEEPALNCLDSYDISYESLNLMNIVNMLFSNKVCIIPPESMVRILNRYFMIKAAKRNEAEGKCMYCAGTGCKHFSLPKDDEYFNTLFPDVGKPL